MSPPAGAGSALSFAALPPAVRRTLLEGYRASLVRHLDQLAAHERDGWRDDAPAVAEVHRLGGAAGFMQDTAVSQPARALERLLREGRLDEARRAWPVLVAAVHGSIEHLDRTGEAGDAG